MVGRNLEQLLTTKGLRQQDFADLIQRARLADWPQETISRFVKGGRNLSLEDALLIAAGLQVPLARLLDGDDTVLLAGKPVTAAQLRDVITAGRVQTGHAADSPLDVLSDGGDDDTTALEHQLAQALGVRVPQMRRAARRVWDLPPQEELDVRMARSLKRWREGQGPIPPPRFAHPDDRTRRAWRGHHVRAMAEQLAEYMGIEL